MAIAVKKEKMAAVLEVSPFEEMSKDSHDWCRKNPVLRNRLKNFEIAETVKLDPRKWNEKLLRKALVSLVRYELKLFDVKVGDIIKDAKEAGPKGEIEGMGKVIKLYEKIGKEIAKKVSLALEEIEEDKGDNAKGLREGKKALKAMSAVDYKKLFAATGVKAQDALSDLATALGKGDDDESARDKAGRVADTDLDAAITEFDKRKDSAFDAIILLQKTGRKIAKNEDAGPELRAFGKDVEACNALCEDLIKALETYGSDLVDVLNDVRRDKLDAMKARKAASALGATAPYTKTADSVRTAIGKLNASFAKVQQVLK